MTPSETPSTTTARRTTSTPDAAPTGPPRLTRRQQQANATRTRIARAALGLFAEQGYAATSTRQIAEAADVSEGLIFRHFPTKLELLRAVSVQRRTFGTEVRILLEAAGDLPALGCLRTIGDGFVDLVRNESELLNVIVGESRTNDELYQVFCEVFEETTSTLTAYFERRIAAGELRPDLPLQSAAHSYLGPLFLFFLTNKHLGDEEWATRSRAYVGDLLDMWYAGARQRAGATGDET